MSPERGKEGGWLRPKLLAKLMLLTFVLTLSKAQPALIAIGETPDDDELIREAIPTLNLKNASCVVFAGDNTAGVKELKKFLRHDETLTVEEVNGKLQLNAHEPNTPLPSFSVDLESRSRLFTLTDAAPDLPAQLFNRRVLETAGGLKVVIVENFTKLLGDNYYETLTAAVKNVVGILGERVQWYNASVALVATKVNRPNLNDTEVIAEVKYEVTEFVKYVEKQREEALVNNDAQLAAELEGYITVGNFLLQQKAFGILRVPNAEKSPWELPPLKKNYNQLRKLLFEKLEFSPRIGSDARVTVTAAKRTEVRETWLPNAQNRMKVTLEGFVTSLETALYGKLFDQFDDYWGSFFTAALGRLYSFEHLDSLAKLLEITSKPGEDVASLAYLIEFYHEVTKESFVDYEKDEISGLKSQFETVLRDAYNNRAFLAGLHSEFETWQVQRNLINDTNAMLEGLSVESFASWQEGLADFDFSQDTIGITTRGNAEMVKQVEALAQSVLPVEVNSTSGGLLHYSGQYVFLSEVNDLILENAYTEVEVVALRKLFVDCDLQLVDTHLTIVAPVMEVLSESRFSLIGSDAEPTPNTAGASGSGGFSSGNFYLAVQEIVNAGLLAVESIGGNGSDGVDGSDGADDTSDYFDPGAECIGKHDAPDKVDDINRYFRPPYNAWYSKHNCNWFDLECDVAVTVTKNYQTNPPVGTNGGDAGAGALAGKLPVSAKILTTVKDGSHGMPGRGGRGGLLLRIERKYWCENSAWSFDVYCDRTENNEDLIFGNDGADGSSPTSPIRNYQHQQQRVPFNAFLHLSLRATFHHAAIKPDENFLKLASEEIVVNEFTTKNFFQFLGAVQDAFVNTTHTVNLKIVVGALYKSFNVYKALGKEPEQAYLDLIDLMFVDTLSKCDSLSRGRQVVKLGQKIDNEIGRLEEVQDIQQELFVYDTVKKEGEEAAQEVKEAREQIQEFYDSEMVEIEEGVKTELDELVTNVYEEREEYYENIAELKKAKKQFQRAMRRKVIGKIFGSALQIASAWFPVAGVVGSAVTGLGNSGPNGDVNIEELLPDITNAADNAAIVIAEYWLEREVDLRSKQEGQLKAAQLFLEDTDIAMQVLNAQEFEDASQVVDASSNLENVEDELWEEFYKTFDFVEEKIVSARTTVENEDDKVKLGVFETVFDASKSGFLLAKDVLGFVSDINSVNSRLEQFDAAMDANRLAIEQLDAYRQMIDDLFIPMLEDMRDRLDNMQTELEDAKSVVIAMKEFKMKKKIREFTDFVFRFTEGLLEEDDFAALSAQLEDVVSVLADGYDKIEEIGNRLEMKQFIGGIVGGNCEQAEDRDTCYAYEAARAEVDKSHLLVAFIEIFAAYRRVIFPFGADKVKVLGKLVENLRNSTLDSPAAIMVVQESLGVLKDDLDDMSTSITNMDRDIIYATFNPKYRTGRAFYTWPAGNAHLAQIEDLINGEVVSLVAHADHEDARNAVKFKVVGLNLTSSDPKVNARVQDLLLSFRLEATHQGPSHYRCGDATFVMGSDPLHFSVTYELDENGNPIEINEALSKLKNGDVPLSPYTVWRFQLKHIASDDLEAIRAELLTMAGLLDVELIGEGYYVKEESTICNELNNAYDDIKQ